MTRLLCAVLMWAWALPAHAATIPWLHTVFESLAAAADTMAARLDTALASAQVALVVNVLFASFALFLFVWKFTGFALRGFDVLHILELMFTIFFVYLLLRGYMTLLPAVVSAGRYVTDNLGTALIGSPPDVSLAESIFSSLLPLTLHAKCTGLCIKTGLLAVSTTIVGYLAIIALGVLAVVVQTWTQWAFHVAYAVGWATIPFLLSRRLSFIFDGWLKFFIGTVMYEMVAKIALSLVVLSFRFMQGSAPHSMEATIDVRGPSDLAALFAFILVGAFVLLCTSRVAAIVVQGVSGVSGVLQDMARGAARAAGHR
jgi:hypothetical protein